MLRELNELTACFCRYALVKTGTFISSKFPKPPAVVTETVTVQPVPVPSVRQPIHPIALYKQSRSNAQQTRWFSSSTFKNVTSRLTKSARPPRPLRSSLPTSRVGRTISSQAKAPFASALRPNLTGGTLCRSSSGYSLGGSSVRHFSYVPQSQAQVIQNVSQGMRTFCLGGKKVRYDGTDPRTGEKRYKAVSQKQHEACKKMESVTETQRQGKGTTLEFNLSPNVTALGVFSGFKSHGQDSTPVGGSLQGLQDNTLFASPTLNTPALLHVLSIDFARALRDLATIHSDLQRLAALGDLPISLSENGTVLRIRFLGCDAETVERLCDEVGVRRGIIREDTGWHLHIEKDVEMALLFPFAESKVPSETTEDNEEQYLQRIFSPVTKAKKEPVDWTNMLSPLAPASPVSEELFPAAFSPHLSTCEVRSVDSKYTFHLLSSDEEDQYIASDEYDSIPDNDSFLSTVTAAKEQSSRTGSNVEDYEGLQGIYKFLAECDSAKR